MGGGGLKSIRGEGERWGFGDFGVFGPSVYNWRAALSSDPQSTSRDASGILTGISVAVPLSPLGLY